MQAGLDVAYKKHHDAYCKIFDRCGLEYIVVEAHSGAMGGSQSHEFMIASDAGEDFVARCANCGYRANLEKAVSQPTPPAASRSRRRSRARGVSHTGASKPSPILRNLQTLPETSQMKSLVMVVDGKPVLVMMRGDHQLSETKLSGLAGNRSKAGTSSKRSWTGSGQARVRSGL
jgi:prolyl-tRNA synthetase